MKNSHLIKTSIRFNKVILNLLTSPSFALITIVGNIIIMFFSFVFYTLESGTNPEVNQILDAIWWGFSTATTVGYGDIIPTTNAGKILGIILMLTGTALFATYTALFAQSIIEDEFFRFKRGDNLDVLKERRDMLNKKIERLENE